ncbi:hypothetical protein QW71_35990 [Paenibacillus sp. IHB B 3415]|nr:hypothetical protein QW71_35990 [Paenibacillus sp. IHB B 3415]
MPHNTVTPIVRRAEDGGYEMDLVLRNNRTSEEYPEGIFHPHREMHHIKKENIGLIEVMGLAILPGRLKEELDAVAGVLAGDTALLEVVQSQGADHPLALHASWIAELAGRFGTSLSREEAVKTVQNEVGTKFTHILEHAGVYKRTPEGQAAFRRFVNSSGFN